MSNIVCGLATEMKFAKFKFLLRRRLEERREERREEERAKETRLIAINITKMN